MANLDEEQWGQRDQLSDSLRAGLTGMNFPIVPVCGKLEMELAELPLEDRLPFMEEMGLAQSALEVISREAYKLLDLVTFYTTVGKELRAWPVLRNTKAPAAAGRIHTDMESGFIKAEVVPFSQLIESGSEQGARHKGALRIEGKEYLIQDGDVVFFHFRD